MKNESAKSEWEPHIRSKSGGERERERQKMGEKVNKKKIKWNFRENKEWWNRKCEEMLNQHKSNTMETKQYLTCFCCCNFFPWPFIHDHSSLAHFVPEFLLVVVILLLLFILLLFSSLALSFCMYSLLLYFFFCVCAYFLFHCFFEFRDTLFLGRQTVSLKYLG